MVANDEFFQRPQAAAVLKHGVLARYATVFAAMAGSRTGRVVYLDGYAGAGRYDDGSPGSPLLAIRTAARSATWGRAVECLFVEKKPALAAQLREVLTAEAPAELSYQVWDGDVADHVDEALRVAGDDPMLTFLDPFGAALGYDLLTQRLLGRAAHQPSEVLLSLNLEMVRRIGGLLGASVPRDADQLTLGRLDATFGGDWWRAEFASVYRRGVDGSAAHAAMKVATSFVGQVRAATGCIAFGVPVRRRTTHAPLFLLLLFTRYPLAPWKFNEQVSLANAEWREACWQVDTDELIESLAGQGEDMFGDSTSTWLREAEHGSWLAAQKTLEQSWVQLIADNLRGLLAAQPSLRLGDHTRTVFGSTLGLARDKHVNAAWRQLAAAGEAAPKPPGTKHLERAWLSRQEPS